MGGKRQPNGYFRLTLAEPAGGPYTVSLRTRLADALLSGNVSDGRGAAVGSFSVWVDADLSTPAVVLRCETSDGVGALGAARVEWVRVGSADCAWLNRTDGGARRTLVLASVQAKGDAPAARVLAAAAAANLSAAFAAHTAWWASYWEGAFVTLPVTRLESFYYAEMFRFAASDRVGLHGLMGAFGPTGNYNLWPDDVWDMNEQVMYWIAAASNRPAISAPLEA